MSCNPAIYVMGVALFLGAIVMIRAGWIIGVRKKNHDGAAILLVLGGMVVLILSMAPISSAVCS